MIYDFTIPTETIKYKDQPVLDVRGLSFNDISYLVNQHREDVQKLVALWDSYSKEDVFETTREAVLIQYGFELLTEAPGILAHIIAVSADNADKDTVMMITRLPATVQIDALKAVGKLTIDDFGGVKKMVETLYQTVLANAPDRVRNSVENPDQ